MRRIFVEMRMPWFCQIFLSFAPMRSPLASLPQMSLVHSASGQNTVSASQHIACTLTKDWTARDVIITTHDWSTCNRYSVSWIASSPPFTVPKRASRYFPSQFFHTQAFCTVASNPDPKDSEHTLLVVVQLLFRYYVFGRNTDSSVPASWD